MDNLDFDNSQIDVWEQYEWLSRQIEELDMHKDILEDALDSLFEEYVD